MYALVIDGQIYATDARIPAGARDLETGAWVTPPAGEWTPELAASVGWFPVVIEPRPDDTETHTSERNEPALIDGAPTVTWAMREWTADELAARAEEANATLSEDRLLTTDLPGLQAIIDTTNSTLNQNTAPHLKTISRALRRIIKHDLRAFSDGVD